MKIISPQLIRFIFVGSVNMVLSYSIFLICIYFFYFHYTLALIVEYFFGILNSYFWNRRWTFKSDGNVKKEIRKFIFVYLVMFGLNYVLLSIFIDLINMRVFFAQMVAIIIITPVTFLAHKMWSFVKKETHN
ncbi:MAG: hypothetical protein AUJ37_01350 [Candidatus Magasanikbacteria bacterium CG1_02_41_34]|nr:MAG: hypothetical protein AUJ37_01350 [Candidatus Magasanikbacteria bacterium CG1_02_41_34]